jgi:hypothetical protein
MMGHRLTMFEIANLASLESSYRLLHVQGLPKEPTPHRQLGLLVKKLRLALRQPAVLVCQDSTYAMAIPGDAPLPELQQPLTPHVATLVPEEAVHVLRFDIPGSEERRVALGFLEWAVRGYLMRDNRLWGSGHRYFKQKPEYSGNGTSGIDIYGGFNVAIVQGRDGRLFLALDLVHRYIDSLWLTERASDGDLSSYRWRHCLYHFGPQLYEVQLVNRTGNPIRPDFFPHPKTGQPVDVYTYTKESWGNGVCPYVQSLDPTSPGILYRYPGNDVERHGAAALCKLIHPTHDSQVKKLHPRSIHHAEERFTLVRDVLERHIRG